MGYIREPKNVDLVVGPSTFTEDTKRKIAQAIAEYKKTGKKPQSIQFVTQGSVTVSTHIGRAQSSSQRNNVQRKKSKNIVFNHSFR